MRAATTFLATLPSDLKAADGQTLGYTWAGLVENWRQRAFTSVGDGHGAWEKGGGTLLPFYSRNFPAVTQWAAPVDPQQLMPTLLQLPSTPPVPRRLSVTPDRIQSHGLDQPPDEDAYVYRIRRYIVFHKKVHPSTMGAPESVSRRVARLRAGSTRFALS